jgi:NTP pyrophosphatase (non-canonical NTP hydrolase)
VSRIEDTKIILAAIEHEVARAEAKFAPFNSSHEGIAIIFEEVDELWEAVRRNNRQQAIAEAYQVAAMAVRFIRDLS